jgi:hypothetical protein
MLDWIVLVAGFVPDEASDCRCASTPLIKVCGHKLWLPIAGVFGRIAMA